MAVFYPVRPGGCEDAAVLTAARFPTCRDQLHPSNRNADRELVQRMGRGRPTKPVPPYHLRLQGPAADHGTTAGLRIVRDRSWDSFFSASWRATPGRESRRACFFVPCDRPDTSRLAYLATFSNAFPRRAAARRFLLPVRGSVHNSSVGLDEEKILSVVWAARQSGAGA